MKEDKVNIWLAWIRDVGGTYQFLRSDPPVEPKTPRTPRHRITQRPLDPKKYYRTDSGQVMKRLVPLTEEVADAVTGLD